MKGPATAADREAEIDRVVRRNWAGAAAHVPAQKTPLEDLIASEEAIEDVLAEEDEELKALLRERLGEMRYQTFVKMLEFLFQYGPEPLQVLRMVFALAKAVRPGLIGDMSLDDIAIICGDSGKATVSARIKRIFNEKLEEGGQKATAASFQKRGGYSEAQKGNDNRRKKGRRKRR